MLGLLNHISDVGKKADGTSELVVLGDGDLNSAAYMRAMHEGRLEDFFTLEDIMAVLGSPRTTWSWRQYSIKLRQPSPKPKPSEVWLISLGRVQWEIVWSKR